MWWLGFTRDLKKFIKERPTCQQTLPPQRETLLPTPLPDYLWEKFATDLFHNNDTNYIMLEDYFSQYVKVQKLSSTTSAGVIAFLKAFFSYHGIPMTLMNDNGPQFNSKQSKDFIILTILLQANIFDNPTG